jgi:histidinol dehydrogenase
MPKDIRHAGAIFMGRYTPEAIGDYCAGPNHVLPTSGTARFSSPLGVYDFQKRSSLIMCSEQGVKLWRKQQISCATRKLRCACAFGTLSLSIIN